MGAGHLRRRRHRRLVHRQRDHTDNACVYRQWSIDQYAGRHGRLPDGQCRRGRDRLGDRDDDDRRLGGRDRRRRRRRRRRVRSTSTSSPRDDQAYIASNATVDAAQNVEVTASTNGNFQSITAAARLGDSAAIAGAASIEVISPPTNEQTHRVYRPRHDGRRPGRPAGPGEPPGDDQTPSPASSA